MAELDFNRQDRVRAVHVPQELPPHHVLHLYADAGTAIDWLCKAFGFEVRLRVDGEKPGEVVHSELVLGDGVIMVGPVGRRPACATPKAHESRIRKATTGGSSSA